MAHIPTALTYAADTILSALYVINPFNTHVHTYTKTKRQLMSRHSHCLRLTYGEQEHREMMECTQRHS